MAGIFGNMGGDRNAIAVNPQRPGLAGIGEWQLPGVMGGYAGGTFDMQGRQVTPVDRGDTQQAINQYAAMPQQAPQQKPGFFNHGFGEVLKTILGGALDGVSMHYGGQPGGYDAMMKQQEQAKQLQELMARAQMEAQGRQETYNYARQGHAEDRRFDNANQTPSAKYREYLDAGYTPEQAQSQMQADAASARQKIVATPEGGQAGTYDPMSGYSPIVLPNDGGRPAGAPAGGGGNIPQVTSPDEAMRLPPGSQFMTPDGRIGTVPGGGASNGTGGFRP